LQTLDEIRGLLESHGLSPRKMFGQNFLIDHNLIRKLVDDSGVGAEDLVLEVGPGTGTLTEELLDRGCEVVACEIDRGLCSILRERFGGRAFELIEGDCLASKRRLSSDLVSAVGDRPFRLVANLPYGAATPLMTELLVGMPRCVSMHATIQLEVAQRLLAGSGTPEYGVLSAIAGASAEVRLIARLPRECFWPRPEITSAMVSITRVPPLTQDLRGLADFCTGLFSKRRKQLGAVLGKAYPMPEGVLRTQRAETLEPASLVALFEGGKSV